MPGNSIPTFISNQSTGHFVSMDLPDSEHQGTWSGFVVCCVFVFSKHQVADAGHCNGDLFSFAETTEGGCRQYQFRLDKTCWRSVSEVDNIFLAYLPHSECTSSNVDSKLKRVTVSFAQSDDFLIKSCGVDVVFKEQSRPTRACQITQLD